MQDINDLQRYSKSLKRSRIDQHPERLLGLESSPENQNNSFTNISFQSILLKYDAHKTPWQQYFYISTLCDVMKSFSLNEYDEASDQLITLLKNLCKQQFDATLSTLYYPNIEKLLVIIKVIYGFIKVDDGSVLFNQLCDILLHYYSDKLMFSSAYFDWINRNMHAKSGCSLIANEPSMHLYISLFSVIIASLNAALRYLSATTQSAPLDTTLQHAFTSLYNFINTYLYPLFTYQLFLHHMSEDDKTLFECLNSLIESQLRAESLLGRPVDDKNQPSDTQLSINGHCDSSSVAVRQYYESLYSHNYDCISMFISLIRCVFYDDVTVLLDLICSKETCALQYLLRISKYLSSNIEELRLYFSRASSLALLPATHGAGQAQGVITGGGSVVRSALHHTDDISTHPLTSSPITTSSTAVRAIVWTSSSSSSGEPQPLHLVHPDEWTRIATSPTTDHTLHSSSKTSANIDDNRDRFCTFIQSFVASLQAQHARRLLPFNPALLVNRFEAVISGIIIES